MGVKEGLQRSPGRPRDPRLDDALLEGGLAVMLERGYHAATLTEIARRAGVGTPAIYRRWPTKTHLALEIVVRVAEPEPIPDTDSIREDLIAFMALRLRTWTTPFFRQLVLPMLLEGHGDRGLAAQIRQRFVDYRQALGARIRRSIESGELLIGTNPDRLIDLLMGTVAMPLLFFQDVPTPDEARAIVDQVLAGYSARHPRA
jgi:AcrR family transcriptional regulator